MFSRAQEGNLVSFLLKKLWSKHRHAICVLWWPPLGGFVKPFDPLLIIGLLMLGMAVGALLMRVRYRSHISQAVDELLERK